MGIFFSYKLICFFLPFSLLVQDKMDAKGVFKMFYQVIDHGIDLSLLESIEKVAMDFFVLPLGEKQKYPIFQCCQGLFRDMGRPLCSLSPKAGLGQYDCSWA
jgi:isopenicillin N synthase-like dioxygenase